MKTEKQLLELLKNGWVILCDYPDMGSPFITPNTEGNDKTYAIRKSQIQTLIDKNLIRDTSSNKIVFEFSYNKYKK